MTREERGFKINYGIMKYQNLFYPWLLALVTASSTRARYSSADRASSAPGSLTRTFNNQPHRRSFATSSGESTTASLRSRLYQ